MGDVVAIDRKAVLRKRHDGMLADLNEMFEMAVLGALLRHFTAEEIAILEHEGCLTLGEVTNLEKLPTPARTGESDG